MAYSPPSLADLRPVIRRALRDPDGNIFLDPDVDDFVYEGMSDLSGYRPVENVHGWPWDPDNTGTAPDPGDLNFIWRVEIGVPNYPQYEIPPLEHPGPLRNGWSLFGGVLRLSTYWVAVMNSLEDQGLNPNVTMYGYRDVYLPDSTSPDDILDLAAPADELGVRLYAKMMGFQRLTHDRSLYQQWLAATNNTDVSPTQLQNMVSQAQQEYDRHRKRAAILRRIPFDTFSYVD
jgi:hypothetical protein